MYKAAPAPRTTQPIAWDEAFALDRRAAARPADPGRGVVLHLGPHQQRGRVPLPADGAPVRHEQPAGLLEHVPRVERRRAGALDRHRQGHRCCSRTSTHADLIMVVGQNPGTNHPRMLSALEQAKHNGAHIVNVNPLDEAGLRTLPQPADPVGLAKGTDLTDDFLQVRLSGDQALFAALAKLTVEAGAVDEEFVATHTSEYDEYLAHLDDLDWDDVLGATGLTRAGDRGRSRERYRALGPRDRLLGDGPDPAPGRGGDHPGDHQPAAPARQHRQAGRRAVPGARPLQRAGRPHDGGLGEGATTTCSTGCATSSASSRTASTASTPSTRSGRCTRGGCRCCSSAWAATSWPPRPTPTAPRPPCGAST